MAFSVHEFDNKQTFSVISAFLCIHQNTLENCLGRCCTCPKTRRAEAESTFYVQKQRMA